MEASLEPAVPPAPPESTPPPAAVRPTHRSRWIAQRAVELCTVFAGVYAAFVLNAHQIHRQETQRRAQLLNWLEGVYARKAKETNEEVASIQTQADDFNRQLAAGEMPRLYAFNWSSDYSASDTAGILQSGGYDLLDFETVRAIKDEDSSLRSMVMLLQHDQQLSDSLVLPNLGKGLEVFYDPAAKQLRETYHWYQQFFQRELDRYAHLQKEIAEVLRCIAAEKQRNR